MSITANQGQSADSCEALLRESNVGRFNSSEAEAVLMLDGRGMIFDCNGAGEALFKYRRSELIWQNISTLLPELADIELVQDGQPNAHLRFLCRIGRRFQLLAKDGECVPSELFLNLLDGKGHGRLSLIVCPVEEKLTSNPVQRPTEI